jgi:hypothetical protein
MDQPSSIITLAVDLTSMDANAAVSTVAQSSQQTIGVAVLTGDKGDQGDQGTAATIGVGTVTTGSSGGSASVTNVGTQNAAVFDFTIPRGVQGDVGPQGSVWYSGSGAPTVLHTDGDYYLNTTTGDVYHQLAGAWGSPIENLTGPVGVGTQNNFNTIVTDQTPAGGTYGTLVGAVNGSNTIFTTAAAKYATGTLHVLLNGQELTQGAGYDWVETSPAAGTFTLSTAPAVGSILQVVYSKVVITTTDITGNVDGGTPLSVYGGTTGISGGTP